MILHFFPVTQHQPQGQGILGEIHTHQFLFCSQFLRNLENQVFGRLEDEGWFYDGVEREVETEFYPWLMSKVDAELDNRRKARSLVDGVFVLYCCSLLHAHIS